MNIIKTNSKLVTIPVIVFSLSKRREDVQYAYYLGAAAYVVKMTDLDKSMADLKVLAQAWLKQAQLPEVE